MIAVARHRACQPTMIDRLRPSLLALVVIAVTGCTAPARLPSAAPAAPAANVTWGQFCTKPVAVESTADLPWHGEDAPTTATATVRFRVAGDQIQVISVEASHPAFAKFTEQAVLSLHCHSDQPRVFEMPFFYKRE
jgi:hypothetical protein